MSMKLKENDIILCKGDFINVYSHNVIPKGKFIVGNSKYKVLDGQEGVSLFCEEDKGYYFIIQEELENFETPMGRVKRLAKEFV